MKKQSKVYVYVALVAVLTLVACDAPQAHDNTAQQVVGSTLATKPATIQPSSKIEADLAQAMLAKPDVISFTVFLSEQADFSSEGSSWEGRGQNTYNKLKEVADRTQPAVEAELRRLEGAGQVKRYESFWLTNSFSVVGTDEAVRVLANRNDVAILYLDPPAYGIGSTPVPNEQEPSNETPVPKSYQGPLYTTDWNINLIKAPQVWDRGYRGSQITVGVIDSGAYHVHPALLAHWRGTSKQLPGAEFNWQDFIGPGLGGAFSNETPYDDNGHGTRTIGDAVGNYGSDYIGVAPGAYWIACRAFNINLRSSTSGPLRNCLQWMVAPTDSVGVPHPEYRPQIVVGSWGLGNPTNSFLLLDVRRLVQAGIVPVFAVGNAPNNAGLVDAPASYAESFAVGAVGYATALPDAVLAGYSNHGPSTFTANVKPDVVAPGGSDNLIAGENIRSSAPPCSTPTPPALPTPPVYCSDDGYSYAHGTSDAAPHVSGLIALLLSADRSLTRYQLQYVIQNTAYFSRTIPTSTPTPSPTDTPEPDLTLTHLCCAEDNKRPLVTDTPTFTPVPWGTRPNNDYGWGLIDAKAAVDAVTTGCPAPFSDINGIFASDITFLYCRGVINGISPTLFAPNDLTTRGQFTKIAVLAFGVPPDYTSTSSRFVDVFASNPFYSFIQAAANASIIAGLTAAQCAPIATPCFRPNQSITRGQIAVIVKRAKNFTTVTPASPTFRDVPTDNFAYTAIETLAQRGIISGAACSTGGGLCFRPNDPSRRGELSKIARRAIRSGPQG